MPTSWRVLLRVAFFYFYTSTVSPDGADFTLNVVKIAREHAECTRPALPKHLPTADETVQFYLPSHAGRQLACWRTNFQAKDSVNPDEPPLMFEQQPDVEVDANGRFSLRVTVGDYYTISTIRTATKGDFPDVPNPDSDSDFRRAALVSHV